MNSKQQNLIIKFLLTVIATVFGVEHPHCFRFTWLGAYQDKSNILGLTCEHIREDLTYIPCRKPLVATDNDEPPDMLDLWHNNRHQDPNLFGCPMIPGQSCVKFSYIYNKAVQNITYMCAKVNASDGCYTQKYITGLEVEVCVCKSMLGAMPCNKANRKSNQYEYLVLVFILVAFVRNVLSNFLFKIRYGKLVVEKKS